MAGITRRTRWPIAAVALLAGLSWWGARADADAPMAPPHLDETGLYDPARPGVVAPDNRPFSPQYALWSDGATKSRWVYLPAGTTIDARDATAWEFPVGTRFWKEFAFEGRKVETRMLWRTSATEWVAASYVWNEEQTRATLVPESGLRGVAALAPGKRHSIPSVSDCGTCHGSPRLAPLGFNALQLSTDRDPNAIHAEPLTPDMVTLATLEAEGRLAPSRPEWVTHPPRIRTPRAATRAVLGYLAANCGGCHDGRGDIAALVPALGHDSVAGDGDRVAAALVRHKTLWQVPGVPEGASVLIDPDVPDRSAILVRMHSRGPSSQMPPLGTVVRDERALEAVTQWIATDLRHAHSSSGPADAVWRPGQATGRLR